MPRNGIPFVKDIERHPERYPDWRICPICLGGRGEVVPTFNEEMGVMEYPIRTCPLCQGEKIIQKIDLE